MPRRLYPCTPTRLSAWLDCPRRYRMTYLDRPPPPKGPPWAHNSVGASVHNALAGWWRLPLAQRTVAAAGSLVDRGWIDEGFADETQSARYRERAIDMVEGYVARLDPADEPVGIERTVATRTDVIVAVRPDRPAGRPARRQQEPSSWSSTTRPGGTCSPWTTCAVRWPWRCTRSPRGGCCGGRATGSNCIICHRAGARLVAHRRVAGQAPGPRGGHRAGVRRGGRADAGRPARPGGTTRCSRLGRARPAAGATTYGTARRARRRRRPDDHGTGLRTADSGCPC